MPWASPDQVRPEERPHQVPEEEGCLPRAASHPPARPGARQLPPLRSDPFKRLSLRRTPPGPGVHTHTHTHASCYTRPSGCASAGTLSSRPPAGGRKDTGKVDVCAEQSGGVRRLPQEGFVHTAGSVWVWRAEEQCAQPTRAADGGLSSGSRVGGRRALQGHLRNPRQGDGIGSQSPSASPDPSTTLPEARRPAAGSLLRPPASRPPCAQAWRVLLGPGPRPRPLASQGLLTVWSVPASTPAP